MQNSNNVQGLRIDREQAYRQLELLGYKLGETIYLRAIPGKGYTGSAVKLEARFPNLPWVELEKLQNQGKGIYFVVNGGGHSDKAVTQGKALFCEFDDRPIEEQISFWIKLGLPEPTLQIKTRKSIHSYWVFEKPIPIQDWIEIQKDFLSFTKSDRSLSNSSRVMRLAGAWHVKADEPPIICETIAYKENSAKKNELGDLRQIVPSQGSVNESVRTVASRHCLPKEEQCLLDFRSVGIQIPYWNESGRKGWATFQCPVHSADGNKHSTDHIHVNLSTGAWEAHCGCDRKVIYQAVCEMVGHKNPGSSGENRRVSSRSSSNDGGAGESRQKQRANVVELNLTAIREQIKAVLNQDLPAADLQATKIQLRAANPAISEREFQQLWSAIEIETELQESRCDRAKEVDELVRLGDQSLNLHQFLPEDLAEPLTLQSEQLNIRPEVCLTSLLVAASSLHKTETELFIHKGQGFSVPPTIFAGLVSESGQKKSPIIKAIIKKPMSVLQREKREQFQDAIAQWQKDSQDWDKCKPDDRADKFPDGKPQEPRQRLYYFTGSTGEGMLYQFQAHPDKALLGLVDELVGLFASQNKYSGGRGSDRQDILSSFDGTGATILRANGTKADLDGLLLSIYGSIQPEVLKRLMEDCSDPDGQWARFLFVNQPKSPSELPEQDSGSFDLTDRLLGYYRAIDQLPPIEYRLSRAAYQRYRPVYKQLERLRVTHPSPGMSAVYSKMEGYIGRLALNLHVLHEISSGKNIPDVEISLEVMEMAIALAKFYIGQVKLIHFNNEDSELGPTLVKLINYSKLLETAGKDGWVKAKDFANTITKSRRPKAEIVRSWMREAESLGFGQTRGIGCHLEYYWQRDNYFDIPPDLPPKKVDEVDEKETKVDELSTVQITVYQEVEKKVDKVDDFSISTKSSSVCTEVRQVNTVVLDAEKLNTQELSTLSTFVCNDVVAMVSEVDTESTVCLPGDLLSTFAVGDRVKVRGVDGEVVRIETQWQDKPFQVLTEEFVEWFAADELELFVAEQVEQKNRKPKVGDRIAHGEFTGTLAAKSTKGWFVNWNLCPALLKRFKAPPTVIEENQFKLL